MDVLRPATIVLMVATAIWLYHSDLYRKYRVLFIYLVFRSLRSAVLYPLSVRSAAYFYIWLYTELVLCVLYVLLVLELYSLVLDKYRGIQTLGRWALYGAMVLSVGLSAISLIPPANDPYHQSGNLARLYFVERSVFASLLLFLLLIIFFLTRYPIRLCRNVVIHSIVYSVYFFSSGAAMMVVSMLGYQATRMVSLVLAMGNAGAVLSWLLLLKPKGEEEPLTVWRGWHAGEEERLIAQLDSFNSALLRARKSGV